MHTRASSKTSPSINVSTLPHQKSPSEVAKELIDAFLPTLRYKNQRAAVKDESYRFLGSFALFYTERKSLSTAMSDPTYCHKSVSGSISLQPLKRVEQGAAYQALAAEAAKVAKQRALSESKLILRVKKLNDAARLKECVECFCRSIANISKSCLIVSQCVTTNRHGLVSSLLSNHWADFRHLATYDRTNFVQIYKKANTVTTAFTIDSITFPITQPPAPTTHTLITALHKPVAHAPHPRHCTHAEHRVVIVRGG